MKQQIDTLKSSGNTFSSIYSMKHNLESYQRPRSGTCNDGKMTWLQIIYSQTCLLRTRFGLSVLSGIDNMLDYTDPLAIKTKNITHHIIQFSF